MKNLQQYNQKIVAIIGTVIIGAGILVLLGGIISSLFFNFNFGGANHNNGIQLENHLLKEEEKIEQVISYDTPLQLDTAQSKFIVPIGFVNLESKEEAGFLMSRSKYGKRFYSGLYSNFIYFDYKTEDRIQLFNEKVIITEWSFVKKDSIELILFKGVNKDSNQDNKLDSDDAKSLFVYYIKDKELKTYSFENKIVLNYELMPKTNLISLSLGVDLNKDHHFDSRKEPKEIKLLRIDTKQVEELVSSEIHKNIESLLK